MPKAPAVAGVGAGGHDIRPRRSISVAIPLGGVQGTGVAERVLSRLDEGKGVSVRFKSAGGRNRRIRGGGRHLGRRKQGQFLGE